MAKNYDPGLLLVAIIGIVAVISLVVLVMNSGGQTSFALSDVDLAGQAPEGYDADEGYMGFLKALFGYNCGCAGNTKICQDICPEGEMCYLKGCGMNADGTCDGGVCTIVQQGIEAYDDE